MTTCDLHSPASRSTSRWAERLKDTIMSGYRTMQYAQMLRVLSQLSDAQLKAMGITRQAIPDQAHKCIYGSGE